MAPRTLRSWRRCCERGWRLAAIYGPGWWAALMGASGDDINPPQRHHGCNDAIGQSKD
jgi:hypothetical protein